MAYVTTSFFESAFNKEFGFLREKGFGQPEFEEAIRFLLWFMSTGTETTILKAAFEGREKELTVTVRPTPHLTGQSDSFNERFLAISLKWILKLRAREFISSLVPKLNHCAAQEDMADALHGSAKVLQTYGADLLAGNFSFFKDVTADLRATGHSPYDPRQATVSQDYPTDFAQMSIVGSWAGNYVAPSAGKLHALFQIDFLPNGTNICGEITEAEALGSVSVVGKQIGHDVSFTASYPAPLAERGKVEKHYSGLLSADGNSIQGTATITTGYFRDAQAPWYAVREGFTNIKITKRF